MTKVAHYSPHAQAIIASGGYNLVMGVRAASCVFCVFCAFSFLSTTSSAQLRQNAVTVPAAVDHNRIIIDVELSLPDGTTQRVHAWVDNGNPELEMSRHLATVLGLSVTCGDQECMAAPPRAIRVGELSIPLDEIKEAHIPMKPVSAASAMWPGMHAEINIPSTVLRHYDVLIDYPGKKVSIGWPGTIKFRGSSAKVQINAQNGLIQVPSEIERKRCNLALDVGSSISFLSQDVFTPLAAAHTAWPHMTGAIGSANMWGLAEEPNWKLMRVDRLHYGPLFLTDVPVVNFPKDRMEYFSKRAGVATAGLLGGAVFLNYRVGLDYARSTVYFELGTFSRFPDFDVIGLVLRPEDDGRYTILGTGNDESSSITNVTKPLDVQAGDSLIAVDGIPVRGSTMGQVWAMLGGTPGQERKLTIERGGRQFTVAAQIQHFLGETSEEKGKKKK
jgi:hypothetical protein